jgi:hypothetical protein
LGVLATCSRRCATRNIPVDVALRLGGRHRRCRQLCSRGRSPRRGDELGQFVPSGREGLSLARRVTSRAPPRRHHSTRVHCHHSTKEHIGGRQGPVAERAGREAGHAVVPPQWFRAEGTRCVIVAQSAPFPACLRPVLCGIGARSPPSAAEKGRSLQRSGAEWRVDSSKSVEMIPNARKGGSERAAHVRAP